MMNNEELRGAYISFISQLRGGSFNEGLYDSIFDTFSQQIAQWKSEEAVPMRMFEVCIDMVYALAKNDFNLLESDKEKVRNAQNEIYGLLMGYE